MRIDGSFAIAILPMTAAIFFGYTRAYDTAKQSSKKWGRSTQQHGSTENLGNWIDTPNV